MGVYGSSRKSLWKLAEELEAGRLIMLWRLLEMNEAREISGDVCRGIWKLVETFPNMVELPLMKVTEASTSTDCGNFRLQYSHLLS